MQYYLLKFQDIESFVRFGFSSNSPNEHVLLRKGHALLTLQSLIPLGRNSIQNLNCGLVNYDTHTNAYKLFNQEFVVNCDVTFDKTCIGPRTHKTSQEVVSLLEQNTSSEHDNLT